MVLAVASRELIVTLELPSELAIHASLAVNHLF